MTLTTSLLMASASTPDLDATPEEPQNDDEEPHVPFLGSNSQKFMLFAGVAAIAFNTLALLAAMAPLAIANTALAVCFSLRIIKNEYEIANMGSLRYYINKMRQEIGRLGGEVDKLSQSNDALEAETTKLKGIEEELGNIAGEQNVQMDDFMNLLDENKKTIASMKRTLDLIIYQNLTGFIIDADLSHNHNIDGPEIDLLLHRLDAFDYFDVNEEALRKIIADNDGDIYKIITAIIEIIEQGKDSDLLYKNTANIIEDHLSDAEQSGNENDDSEASRRKKAKRQEQLQRLQSVGVVDKNFEDNDPELSLRRRFQRDSDSSDTSDSDDGNDDGNDDGSYKRQSSRDIFHSTLHGVSGAAHTVGHGVSGAAHTVGHGVSAATHKVAKTLHLTKSTKKKEHKDETEDESIRSKPKKKKKKDGK